MFEAQTFQLASLRTAVAPGDEDASRKLAPAERSERLRRQREALTGLELTGPLEPAHYLYDKYAAMLDQDELQYIPPSRCMTRQQELAGEKPDKMIQLDSSKSGLVVKSAEPEREVIISSDLALQQAMTRRNLAMDLVGLATFSVLQRWTTRLFTMYQQPPAPGFQKVSQAQLLRADRHAFVRLNELGMGSLKRGADARLPLDALIDSLHMDVSVTYFLLPVPIGNAASSASTAPSQTTVPKRTAEATTPGPASKRAKKASKGKSKQGGRDPTPKGLRGGYTRTEDGRPICFNYNLGKCSDAATCGRVHVCTVCRKSHPQTEHK